MPGYTHNSSAADPTKKKTTNHDDHRMFLVVLGVMMRSGAKAVSMSPYGSWRSPLKASSITEGFKGLSGVEPCGSVMYWLESRPKEGGRNVVMRRKADGEVEEAIPAGTNARTRVHEYGGGAWYPLDESTVVYSEFKSQRLYVNDRALTEEPERPASLRFADVSHYQEKLFCVLEEHTESGEVLNSIAQVSLEDGSFEKLSYGFDFYAAPRVSPDGSTLAFVRWSHPNMPWDATELVLLDLETKREKETIGAGGDESVLQPHWNPVTGELFYISDRSGWYSLYKVGTDKPVLAPEADLGGAAPGWMLGQRGYDFDSSGSPVVAFESTVMNGEKEIEGFPPGVANVRVDSEDAILFVGSSPDAPSFVGRLAPGDAPAIDVVQRAAAETSPIVSISRPRKITFPTTDDGVAHAYVYEPSNEDYEAPDDGSLPPLLVKAHGGPTACARTGYSPVIQFWTSRGFVVADVDYRGSTNYGRDYRRSLRYKWGIYDVDDVCSVAQYLVDEKIVDPNKLAIDGGSAGGYTTLGALAWKSVFKAGTSMYGVADLSVLVRDTHKFESRYIDRLVGKWPEDEALYNERAPIQSVDDLDCPVLLLQGDEDKIVPPNQAQLMYDKLKEKKIPTALKIYKGEQHGFRKAENIIDALNSELYFYSRVFQFDLPEEDDLAPFPIDNLPP